MSTFPHIRRRDFLKQAATVTTTLTLPKWFAAETEAAPARTKRPGPNEQPAIALVGCGGMGRYDARLASAFGRIVAICDLDDERLAATKKDYPDATTHKDFRHILDRDDIHVVLCGTVDHWHTLVSMGAAKSGKDVYCEKPLTLTIDEGKRLVATIKKTGRVLQTGSQQRSDKNFRLACELVRNGRLGQLDRVVTVLPAGLRAGPFAPSTPPATLDWDFWQGQTATTPYVKERTHMTFRYWLDYSGGTMTDWGAHHNDIALWGIGMERSGPQWIDGKSLAHAFPGGYDAPSAYLVEYTYANGLRHICRSTPGNNISGGPGERPGPEHGVTFHGSEGWIFVTRGKLQASKPELLQEPLPPRAIRLYPSSNHMGDFFESVRTRYQPACDAEIGHRSASVCHLGVISMRLGRRLQWHPTRESFIDDPVANTHLAREMRAPYNYDMIA